ncbi:MAG: Gfo/Idh/MocA family oxidoreductase [Gemmatimonadaceae bacterium]
MTNDKSELDRRAFLKNRSATGLGLMMTNRLPVAKRVFPATSANENVVVAVIGLNGRGQVHARKFPTLKNSEVAYLCDVDSTVLAKALTDIQVRFGRAVGGITPAGPWAARDSTPPPVSDFRRALDDKHVGAVSIATPDHWHAPMAILAMAAGKHVYLKKPCGHNPRGGELPVTAQEQSGRVVQMGTAATVVGPDD